MTIKRFILDLAAWKLDVLHNTMEHYGEWNKLKLGISKRGISNGCLDQSFLYYKILFHSRFLKIEPGKIWSTFGPSIIWTRSVVRSWDRKQTETVKTDWTVEPVIFEYSRCRTHFLVKIFLDRGRRRGGIFQQFHPTGYFIIK